MTFDPNIHHRKSIRLKGYDYSRAGMYFITICIREKVPLFGICTHQTMMLNDYGIIARDEWLKTAQIRHFVELGEFVIMPNHMHGILIINHDIGDENSDNEPLLFNLGTTHRAPTDNEPVPLDRGMTHHAPTVATHIPQTEQFGKPTSNSIPTIIRGYKSSVTKQINILRNRQGKSVWQHNYYENVIKDDRAFHFISEYIKNNPANWKQDRFCL